MTTPHETILSGPELPIYYVMRKGGCCLAFSMYTIDVVIDLMIADRNPDNRP